MNKQADSASGPDEPANLTHAGFADRIYRLRRVRSQYFPHQIFAEPAWDIILLLYCAEAEGKRLTVSAVGHSGIAPQSTILRWLDRLVRTSLIIREKHATDRRMCWVRLTPAVRQSIEAYLSHSLAHFSHRVDQDDKSLGATNNELGRK